MKQKVLIVDDQRFNINVLVDLLKEDYKTVVAKDGEQALKRATSDPPPDLILLDVMMPGIDGYEVCRQLKLDDRTKEIPVIFITAMSEEGDETKGLELGAVDYITKPLSPPIVIARVRNHLELVSARTRAEAASQAKADFLATMSHEIRTPMNGVIGMVDLLMQTRLETDQKQMLQTISDSGQLLLTIINDILDFSKIEAGKMEIEAIPFSLIDAVEGSVQTIATNAINKGLRLITYIDPDLPQFITGDPVRLRQILINLCSNAIKFTEKGDVVIRADRIEDNNKKIVIRFSVVDQGIGISKEGQDKLFKSFSQVDSSTTRKFGGTGLGLSICHSLSRMMGGKIGVESTPGEGSEFYVTIPFAKNERSSDQDISWNLKDLRVFLINSNETEQTILKQYLEYWNANVVVSNELNSCIDQCRCGIESGTPFDVVVLGSEWSREEQSSIIEKAKEIDLDINFVSLLKGKRQQMRFNSPKVISMDADPLRRASFLTAVAIAAGRASPEEHFEEEMEELKTTDNVPTVDEARKQGTLILVCEDNPTNRDVIQRQLRILGYACELAENGKQALEAWRNNDYAVLLTDCHMPEMDGFELTDAIRKEEQSQGAKRKPIIAITANVLQGETERCLAAGMDDYLAKPFKIKDLKTVMQKWLQGTQPVGETVRRLSNQAPVARAQSSYNADVPIDDRALKDEFGEDPETFKEILVEFVEPARVDLQELEKAWQDRSAKGVGLASHKLKSACKTIGANALSDMCNALERASKENDWDTIDEQAAHLNELMEDVTLYVKSL